MSTLPNRKKDLGPPGTPLPANAVYIGRRNPRYGSPASEWADRIGFAATARVRGDREVPRLDRSEARPALPELKGKDLVCWCAPERCHGEVLLELLEQMDGTEEDQPRKRRRSKR